MTRRRSRYGDETDNVVPLSPGKRLQKARQALNLTSQEVATRIRVQEDVIQAIEDDGYEGIAAAAVYVRGYIRSYARLVGLEPESLIKAYGDISGENPPRLQSVTSPDFREEIRKGAGLAQRIGYAALVIASGALLAWWQSEEVEIPQHTSSLVPELAEPVSEQKSLSLPGVPTEATSAESGPVHRVIMLSGGTASPKPGDQQAGPSPTGEITAPQPEGLWPTAPESGLLTETPVQSFQSAGASGSASANGPRLVLELSSDSWNQVIDGQGNRVAHGLAKGGESIQIHGEPPFKAVIGNSPGVTVLYDGKPIDISPFSRSSVARFTLEADGSLSP